MKYLMLLFILFVPSLLWGQVSWMPLSVGNEYQYRYDDSSFCYGKIVKDTVVNGKTYYDFSNIIRNLPGYIRQDSLGNIYSLALHFMDTMYVYQPEYLLVPFNAAINDTWLIARHKELSQADVYGKCTMSDSLDIYGKIRKRLWITINEPVLPCYFDFLDGIGVYGWSELDGYGNSLNYAKINGIEYGTLTGVNDKKDVVSKFGMAQNYPNPFNPSTTINYQLPKNGLVTIKVFDILGNEVKTLVNEYKAAGNYSINFDAAKLSGGVYFYRIISGNYTLSKKMVLLK